MKDTGQVNPGWYGWLGDFHDVSGYYPTTCDRAYFLRHNINWFWLGHQWVVPFLLTDTYHVREGIVEFKKQARIWYEPYWWGDHSRWGTRSNPHGFALAHIPGHILSQLERSGIKPGGANLCGKDWRALAEHPELLSRVEKTISWQLETIFRYCGEDALYGVVLSEEEPIHGAGQVLGEQGLRYYENHKKELIPALIKVHNHLYNFIKSLYPRLKVSPGFYPEWVRPGTLAMDAVCMDLYPDTGREYQALRTWERAYGRLGKEQYILLWGYGNRDRKLECAHFDKTLSLLMSKGIRNIGFFDPRASLQDKVHRLFDTYGTTGGPYSRKRHLGNVRKLWKETSDVAARFSLSTKRRIPALPLFSVTAASSQARMQRSLGRIYDFREKMLDLTYDHVQRMKYLQKTDQIVAILIGERFLPATSGNSPSMSLSKLNEWEQNLSKEYETLPNYYRTVALPEKEMVHYTQSLSTAIHASLDNALLQIPLHVRTRVSTNISEGARFLSEGNMEQAWRRVLLAYRALVSARCERSFVFELVFFNHWRKSLNLRVTLLARWNNGSTTELYFDEPFTTSASAPKLSLHLPAQPEAIIFQTSSWTGDVKITSLEIRNSRLRMLPKKVIDTKGFKETGERLKKKRGFTVAPWNEEAHATFIF